MLGLPQGHNIIIKLLCDVTRPQLKRLNLHFNQTVNTNIISLRRRNTIYLQFNFISLSYKPILSDFVLNNAIKWKPKGLFKTWEHCSVSTALLGFFPQAEVPETTVVIWSPSIKYSFQEWIAARCLAISLSETSK